MGTPNPTIPQTEIWIQLPNSKAGPFSHLDVRILALLETHVAAPLLGGTHLDHTNVTLMLYREI